MCEKGQKEIDEDSNEDFQELLREMQYTAYGEVLDREVKDRYYKNEN